MYWEIYAFIFSGEIKDICVFDPNGAYTEANKFAKMQLGVDAIAVRVNEYPVKIGDSYDNGHFYRDGRLIEKLPSTDEQINKLELAIAELGEIIGG